MRGKKPTVTTKIGDRFGRLIVVSAERRIPYNKRPKWTYAVVDCLCDCGKTTTVRTEVIRTGHTQSCGCINREVHSSRGKHWLSRSPEYKCWLSMIHRCSLKEGSPNYKYYAGKGVTVCDRWKESVVNFIEDMGARPSLRHTIDRIDSNGNYEPSNCKWSTPKEQSANTSNCKMVLYKGEMVKALELDKISVISPELLRSRLRQGWDIERAISTPKKTKA